MSRSQLSPRGVRSTLSTRAPPLHQHEPCGAFCRHASSSSREGFGGRARLVHASLQRQERKAPKKLSQFAGRSMYILLRGNTREMHRKCTRKELRQKSASWHEAGHLICREMLPGTSTSPARWLRCFLVRPLRGFYGKKVLAVQQKLQGGQLGPIEAGNRRCHILGTLL